MEGPSLLEDLLELAFQPSKDQLLVAQHEDFHLHLGKFFARICLVGGPSGAGCGRECFNVGCAGASSVGLGRAASDGRGGCAGVVGVAVGSSTVQVEGGDWTAPIVPIMVVHLLDENPLEVVSL